MTKDQIILVLAAALKAAEDLSSIPSRMEEEIEDLQVTLESYFETASRAFHPIDSSEDATLDAVRAFAEDLGLALPALENAA